MLTVHVLLLATIQQLCLLLRTAYMLMLVKQKTKVRCFFS